MKKLKTRKSYNEYKKDIKKVMDDIIKKPNHYNSHSIVDLNTGYEFNTSFACDCEDYQTLNIELEKLRENVEGLKIKVYEKTYFKAKAFDILENVIKHRFFYNVISNVYEQMVVCAFKDKIKAIWHRNRFKPVDIFLKVPFLSSKGNEFDVKVVKLSPKSSLVEYDYNLLKQGNKEEHEKVITSLIKNNKNGPVSYEDRFIFLFVTKNTNETKLIEKIADVDSVLRTLELIAIMDMLKRFAFTVEIDGRKINAIMIPFFVE